VRVGPFASKEEADKAAEKIRKLNLQATVLKL
jgi:cell division protein FtsN